ncbi:MAG: hypothetical protein HYS13_06930 [Planctomycetia bacterium]|nr:hypothetical protein [Planctomycetia bacterium]
MNCRSLLSVLLAGLVVLLILAGTLLALARLLAAVGDAPAASVCEYLALAAGVLIVVEMFSLTLLIGCLLLSPRDPPDSPDNE